jgi:arabinogalactan oligomer/maltooligosaccharide transport system substrate-binding protein
MYAYPLTADNGYFMYYDKSVIPEEDVDSLEKLIEDCEANQKYFAMELQTSAWYIASFFFATGCVSEWKTDEGGEFISVYDTFDSPEGLIAAKGIEKLVKSPFHLSSSKAAEFASGAAVVVTGIWDFTTAQEILGDNMGITDLPSFEVDGKEYHLGSFSGCKLLGVKPQVDAGKATALTLLAAYLTGEKCQLERFNARAWGPSNLAAQQNEAVQANPGLVALAKQNQFATVQGQIHGSWWDIAKVIGEDIKAAEGEEGLQGALDAYYDKIAGLFTLSDEVKHGYTVIGMYNEADGFFFTDYSDGKETWTADLPMIKGDDGVWKTEQAWELVAGTEFKVRQGLSWDVAYPGDNFKVEADGTYYIAFDEAAETVSLIPAE